MMKKLTYFLTMLFAVALLSTSCCKEDDPLPEPEGITAEMLEGDWEFQSLDFNGVTYTSNVCLAPELSTFGWVKLGLENVNATAKTLTFTNGCTGATFDFDFTITKENLDYFLNVKLDGDVEYKFQILNTELNVGDELQIKLIEAKPTNALIGGTYTLY